MPGWQCPSTHRVFLGDARNMAEVAANSVHLIVTSPPYWQLKDYGVSGQIGFHQTYEEYINSLNLVWQECYRVLHPGCRLCINVGDQFARSVYYGRYKVIPIRTEITRFCETLGMDYMGAIIWQKVTTCNTTGGATVMGSFPYPRNGVLKLDYEFILLFKKLGEAPRVSREIKEQSKLTTEEWNTYFAGHWHFGGEKQDAHLAAFPEELPRRLIRMFTFPGETVLDPFLGSGTTSLAAARLGRNSIGYEVNPDFAPIIRDRFHDGRGREGQDVFPFGMHELVVSPCSRPLDLQQRLQSLPYRFQDPHGLDARLDPRTLTFGSRVDKRTPPRYSRLHSVERVLTPELLRLDGGLVVRLLGVRTRPATASQAAQLLERLTAGQRVELKFDLPKHDTENRPLCYLYLANRTFVNARLVRSGLVDVDTAYDYRHKERFLGMAGQAGGLLA